MLGFCNIAPRHRSPAFCERELEPSARYPLPIPTTPKTLSAEGAIGELAGHMWRKASRNTQVPCTVRVKWGRGQQPAGLRNRSPRATQMEPQGVQGIPKEVNCIYVHVYVYVCICVQVYMCVCGCVYMCPMFEGGVNLWALEIWSFLASMPAAPPGGYFAILCLPDTKWQSMPGPRARACMSILLLLESTIGFGVFCKVLELHRNGFGNMCSCMCVLLVFSFDWLLISRMLQS